MVALPLFAACADHDDGKTVGQKLDAAVARTEQTASDLKESAKAGVAEAQAVLREGAEDARLAGQRANDTLTRANDAIIRDSDDTVITASVNAGLLKDPDLSALKIDVDTRAGVVSLYGPAPSAAAKDRADAIALAVKGVVRVDNRLTVKGS